MIKPLYMTQGEYNAFILGWRAHEAGAERGHEWRRTHSWLRGWDAACGDHPIEDFLPKTASPRPWLLLNQAGRK